VELPSPCRPSDLASDVDAIPNARMVTLENASHFSALEQPVEMARILIGAAGIRAGAGFETAETGPRGRRGTERKAEDYHSPVGKALRHGSPTRLAEDPKA
jgi:hypothetical protein